MLSSSTHNIKKRGKVEILCTLGPASMNDRVIARLEEIGISLFRINMSHTKLSDVSAVIRYLQSRTSIPVCLDTEGAQIRTGTIVNGDIILKDNSIITIHKHLVPGDPYNFNLCPADIIKNFKTGDLISIDFNSVLLQVIEEGAENIKARVLNGGLIGQSKAVNLDREIDMPALSIKDRKALSIGMELGIRHVALSFANRGSDVDEIRSLVDKDTFVISKIENYNGLLNFDEIADKSDAILLDRGDLSRQVPIERIPALQKTIIKRSKAKGVKIFVATNLLESMVNALNPTRAEVNDVFNTINDGADGLVLAAETAIGSHPIRCASMVVKLIREFEEEDQHNTDFYPTNPFSLLNDPHGGRLVNRLAKAIDLAGVQDLKTLTVKDTDLFDCEHIAYGAYSPLTGFMDKDTLSSVLNSNRLQNGLVWTLPIVLQVSEDSIRGFSVGDRIALKSTKDIVHALLDITEIYEIDVDDVSQKWFGTTSHEHPGVSRLLSSGSKFIAGTVTLVKGLQSPYHHYVLNPIQTRILFTQKGWNKVVGFHTRNVIHKAHEYIQLKALELSHADGLYISPVIGIKKQGDFLTIPLMKSYQIMMDFCLYPKGRVVVGSFSTYSRYSGPREAVFTALRHKNMGCSHFVVGRDHTGVGDFYKSVNYPSYFEKLGEIGIEPIFFDNIGYNSKSHQYETLSTEGTIESISGTKMRTALLEDKPLPSWFMHEIIQDMLREEIEAGRSIFHE
ncbi:MAG: sulfate adenylyltransferase [Lentimicrobiaceae bacterium]|jgi:pyruvate kinase|nr:sulfate adenylyltransferase [Candidatus Scalindua sp.]MBT6671261.1 sulfate adenylyltransferase [Lentimicrobiaceae bacterium]